MTNTSTPAKARLTLVLSSVTVAGILLALLWLVPEILRIRKDTRSATCHSHLKMIALALEDYRGVNGCYPPAYLPDNDGKPMHSWRVLILPHLGYADLYARYDFTEGWNGPNNSKLIDEMPEVFGSGIFQCPLDAGPDVRTTNYVAVLGPKTIRRVIEGPARPRSGSLDTMLLVEITNSDIVWTEPRDVTFDQAVVGAGGDERCSIGGRPPHRGVHCAINGSVEELPSESLPGLLEELLLLPNGESAEASRNAGRIENPDD